MLSSCFLRDKGESRPHTGQASSNQFSWRPFLFSITRLFTFKICMTTSWYCLLHLQGFQVDRRNNKLFINLHREAGNCDGSGKSVKWVNKPHLVQREGEEKGAGIEIFFRVKTFLFANFICLSLFFSSSSGKTWTSKPWTVNFKNTPFTDLAQIEREKIVNSEAIELSTANNENWSLFRKTSISHKWISEAYLLANVSHFKSHSLYKHCQNF